MVVTQNNSSISLRQHQKAMSVLEKRLAKANAELVKFRAKAEKDKWKAQVKLERANQQAQVKLDKQKKKDQAAIAKRVAKHEAKKVKETQQREQKEAAKWDREILGEEKRQTKIRDSQRWNGSKKLGMARNKLRTQLTKIFKSQEEEIKSLEKAYKKFQSRQDKIYNPATKRWVNRYGKVGRSLQDRVRESWDAEVRAEEELRRWDREIRDEEE